MYLYRCMPQQIVLPDIGICLTFGLAVLEHSASGWKPLRLVPDVSVSRALVEGLAMRCTVNQLEPCHMDDVIEDAIAI